MLKIKDFLKISSNNIQKKRNIILHFHIFKNAGSTIEWILKNNFPKNTLSIDGKNPGDIIKIDEVIDILKKKSSIKTVSSHQIRFPIPKDDEFNFNSILFLRHPIDRAFSIYYFKSKETDNSIGSVKARSMNLEEFIKWNLNFNGYMPMKNFQVLCLSDKTTKEEVGQDDLRVAINRMKSSSIVGIVDRMDESLVIAENLLKKQFPKIDLAYIRQNVSKERKGTIEEKLKQGEEKIGLKLMNELIDHNNLDMKLYQTTNEEMNKRKKEIKNFEELMEDFKRRCMELNTDEV